MSKVLTIMLAGGAGERLYPLTKDCAKPAVPFAGAYRIIDITLSNCINSGLSQDFRFGSSDGTSLHPHPAKRNHFSTRKRRRLRRDRSSPLLAPHGG